MNSVTFAFAPDQGVVVASSGFTFDGDTARALLHESAALFRGGMPLSPWPGFLPPPDVVREQMAGLKSAITALEKHEQAA